MNDKPSKPPAAKFATPRGKKRLFVNPKLAARHSDAAKPKAHLQADGTPIPGARTLARRRALQALFAWELSGRDIRQQLLQIVPETHPLPAAEATTVAKKTSPANKKPPARFVEAVQQFPGYVQVLPKDSNEETLEDLPPAVINQAFYAEVLTAFFEHNQLIDQTLGVFVDRPFAEIDPMEKSLLRLGATEILYFQQTAPRIILNEIIEIAKIFASADSYKYVNGILDKLVKRYRRESSPFS